MESIWESLSKYRGLDWLGISFSMLSTHYLVKKRKRGFLLGMTGNLAFVGFGLLAQSAANIVANGVYFFLNARGWLKWKADPPTNAETAGKASRCASEQSAATVHQTGGARELD